jgi:hypothetical protein
LTRYYEATGDKASLALAGKLIRPCGGLAEDESEAILAGHCYEPVRRIRRPVVGLIPAGGGQTDPERPPYLRRRLVLAATYVTKGQGCEGCGDQDVFHANSSVTSVGDT